jgi:hypothetical protein
MAQFAKVNPAVDGNAGSFFGKSVDFLEIDFGPVGANGNLLASTGAMGAWPAAIRAIEQTATVEILGQLANNFTFISEPTITSNVGVRIATSGVDADLPANLAATLNGLNTDVNGYTVYNVFGNAAAGFANVTFANVKVNAFTF